MARILTTLAIACALLAVSELISVFNGNADQNIAHAQTTPSDSTLSQQVPTVAGIPREQAQAILDRHRKNLLSMPGVYEVGLGEDGILLAVYVHSNSREIDPQALQKAISALPVTVEGVPTKVRPLAILPPPPGVIILRADGTREQADSCPEGFTEMKQFSWQLCIDPGFTEPIPALMEPPTAGIPHEQVLQIYEHHKDILFRLPGVNGVGLGAEGIHVYTDKPELVPKEVEGVPIKVFPPLPPGEEVNHTVTNQVRPMHGSISILDHSRVLTNPNGWGVLTGVVLSEGKPWLVFPAHLIEGCQNTQSLACPIPSQGGPSVLNQCAHYGNKQMVQPPQQNYEITGYTQRWDRPVNQTQRVVHDTAAAFMDKNTTEGDGSLSADRTLENSVFTGMEIVPMVNSTVVVASSQDSGRVSHYFFMKIFGLNSTRENLFTSCSPETNIYTIRSNQIILEQIPGQPFIMPGDSGSPVLANNSIVGSVSWRYLSPPPGRPNTGGGTNAAAIKQDLGFAAWYGTQTVTDNTIGVFRPSAATWYVDNGNGKFDGPCTSAAPTTTRDQCFGYGAGTDVPITGDWDNAALNSPSNDFTVGVYRPTIDPTYFFLSNKNNPPATAVTMAAGPFLFGYRPVTGKWRGNNGASNLTSKVGVFRPSTGGWYVDSGNSIVEGCGTDYCFFLAAGMYQPGDTPIAGDWNNDGITSIGLFRRGIGTASDYFYLSNVDPYTVRNNGTISSWTYAIPSGPGNFGYLPVVGNWTGTGGSKLGVFRPSSGGGIWIMAIFPFLAVPKISVPSPLV